MSFSNMTIVKIFINPCHFIVKIFINPCHFIVETLTQKYLCHFLCRKFLTHLIIFLSINM